MSQLSTDLGHQEMQAVLAVPPAEAGRLLSLSTTTIYQLLRSGELNSFSDGKARRVLMTSIHDYVERRRGAGEWRTWQEARPPRRRRQAAKARAGAAAPPADRKKDVTK